MLKTIIIVPCYNEAKRLDLSKFSIYLRKHHNIFFCFVNDGSKDKTLAILNEFAEDFKERVFVHSYVLNKGKANAIQSGVQYAITNIPGELIGYWDADLAVGLNEISRMQEIFNHKPHLQVLMGARVKLLGFKIIRKPWRHYLGRIFATAASLLLAMPVYDTQCGAKLFRRDCAQAVFNKVFATSWIFDVEMLQRLKKWLLKTMKADKHKLEEYINELPVLAWQEVAGSKIKLRHYFLALLDFIELFKQRNN